MANYYCMYCGSKYPSVANLTATFCPKHPDGSGKGKHVLYEGAEKSQYTCKFCGLKYPTIAAMSASFCPRHPDGFGKGKHTPAL